ncbi:MAG: hypothetical protein AAF985_21575 [Bacteroidota bacterium]
MLNFAMLLNVKSFPAKQRIEDLIFVINSIIALVIAYEYQTSGAKYIQFAWGLTSIIYVVVLIIRKRKTTALQGESIHC